MNPINLLAVLLSLQPRSLLITFAARAHCWFTLSLPYTKTHRCFSAIQSPLCIITGVIPSPVQGFAFVLVASCWFLLAYSANLSRSL